MSVQSYVATRYEKLSHAQKLLLKRLLKTTPTQQLYVVKDIIDAEFQLRAEKASRKPRKIRATGHGLIFSEV